MYGSIVVRKGSGLLVSLIDYLSLFPQLILQNRVPIALSLMTLEELTATICLEKLSGRVVVMVLIHADRSTMEISHLLLRILLLRDKSASKVHIGVPVRSISEMLGTSKSAWFVKAGFVFGVLWLVSWLEWAETLQRKNDSIVIKDFLQFSRLIFV